jgi:hypothetical protein
MTSVFAWLPGILVATMAAGLSSSPAMAAEPRSKAARAKFVRLVPCPSTGQPTGPCPGWIVDHITPLCAGGPDLPCNMQWQTVEAAKVKDRQERRDCLISR